MSEDLPKWTHRLPRNLAVILALGCAGAVAGVAHYFTPKYTQAGYTPRQPVAFSHKTHSAQAGIDCRHCHTSVEKDARAGLPATRSCMSCHGQILKGDPRLELLRERAAASAPIPWVRVHRLPDYVFFNHAVHTRRGVGCVECHGRVDQMDETRQAQPLSMSFCLDCHKDPAGRLRPLDQVFSMSWAPPTNSAQLQNARLELGTNLARSWAIKPGQNCAACHR